MTPAPASRPLAAVAALLGALVAVVAVLVPPAAAEQAAPGARRVLLVSYPRLTWQMVAAERPPELARLLDRAAVASLSVRALGRATTLGEGYATVGAGNRADAPSLVAGLALEPSEPHEGGTAAEAFARRAAVPPDGEVLHLAATAVHRLNRGYRYGAEAGVLGATLAAAGLTAAVVANADRAVSPGPAARQREAALAVMDRHGRVAGGAVGPQLLTADPAAPFGWRLDRAAVAQAFERAWAEHDVVLLEMSDLERADAFAPLATADAAAHARRQALAAADHLLRAALAHVELDRDLVMVLAPAPPGDEPRLTAFAMAGAGVTPGQAASGSTRRAGYVTLPDVAPTVLHALGVPVPPSMTGAPARVVPGTATPAELAAADHRARFRDRATGPASVVFIVVLVLSLALAAVALTRGRPGARSAAAGGALVVLAFPPVAFLAGLVPVGGVSVAAYTLALFGGAAALALLACGAGRRHPLGPPLLLVGLTWLVLIVDVALGGRLQIDTVLGYSATVAGRFAGYGNLAFGLLASSAVVLATGLWAWAGTGRGPLALAAGLLALTVVVDGHPALGSDVGGVLATVPAFAVVLLRLGGRRLGWRRALLVAVATVAVLGLFAALDVTRPPPERTHLGRLVLRVLADGPGSLTVVLERKAATNLAILMSSVWTLVIPVAFVFLALLARRRPHLLEVLAARVPGLRAGLVGALLVGALGFALNDSGVAVPAVVLAVVLPYLAFLAVRLAAPVPDHASPPGAVRGAPLAVGGRPASPA